MGVEDRFWGKVQPTGFCWEWTAATHGGGYGAFSTHAGQQVRAHRYAYELLVGPIPDDLVLDHLCRNKRCVNPDHLEPVTRGENTRRGVNHPSKRTHCPRGHLYDYIDPRSGKLKCRTCRRAQFLAFHARRATTKEVA